MFNLETNSLDRLMRTYGGECSYLDMVILLNEAYDTAMGIFNHSSENPEWTPLSCVKMLSSEIVYNTGKEISTLKRFDRMKLATRFNISITEFWELPFPLAELLFEVAAIPSKHDKLAQDILAGHVT